MDKLHHHLLGPGLSDPMFTYMGIARVCSAAGIAWLLAKRGLAKGSLVFSGAIGAAVVGFTTMAADYVLGGMLIAFYLSGSKFTRVQSALKGRFDLEHRAGGGQRDIVQVFATAGISTLLGARWLARYGVEGGYARLDFTHDAPGTLLFVASLAALATVCGDTWASELGILSKRDPVNIMTCRRVPRGTNGGVSAWGTLMSAAGGAFIGAIALALGSLQDIIEEALIDVTVHGGGHVPYKVPQAALIAVGAAAGLVGSLIDSVLGAVCQATYLDVKSGKITSRLPSPPQRTAGGKPDADGLSVVGVGEGYVLLEDPRGTWRARHYRECVLDGSSPAEAVAAAAAAAGEGTDEGDDADASGSPIQAQGAASPAGAVRRRVSRAPAPATDGAMPAPTGVAGAAPTTGPGTTLRLVRVAGFDVLTNEQTNLVSAAVTSALIAWATRAAVAAAWGPVAAGDP